jgi:hypothetical protein
MIIGDINATTHRSCAGKLNQVGALTNSDLKNFLTSERRKLKIVLLP